MIDTAINTAKTATSAMFSSKDTPLPGCMAFDDGLGEGVEGGMTVVLLGCNVAVWVGVGGGVGL